MVVLILNYRTPDLTIGCLRSVVEEIKSIPGSIVTLLDNGSGDGSSARLRDAIHSHRWEPWVTLVESPDNLGFARGNNLALRVSPPAEYILVLNSDTVIEPGSVHHCLEVMESSPGIGALGIRQVGFDGLPENNVRKFPTPVRMAACALGLPWRFPRCFGWADLEDPRWDRERINRDVDWIGGAFLFVRGETIRKVGGLFDEEFFFTGEDVEFCHRIRRAGYRCFYDSSVLVRHLHGGSSCVEGTPVAEVKPHIWEARYLVQKKCYGRSAALLLRTVDVFMAVNRVLWLLFRRKKKSARFLRAREMLRQALVAGRQRP